MTVLIYQFNNGVFLKNMEPNDRKPLMYKKEKLEPLKPIDKYYKVLDTFFIPNAEDTFDSSKLSLSISELLPMGYELINKGKLKKTITVEEYNNLTDFYKSHYKKGYQKTKITFKEVNSIAVLSFDKDFEPLVLDNLTDFQKTIKDYVSTPYLLDSTLPKEIQHLFEKEITGSNIFNLLSKQVKSIPSESSKGYIKSYMSSIDVSLYEHEYKGEMKRREVLTQKGRPYATRKYTYVKDLPKVYEKRSYNSESFKPLQANNEKDLLLKVEKLLNIITKELV